MNWKLVFQLSLFGLVMAIATVFVIPSTIEPIVWLAIFVICAYIIGRKAPGQYFLHGLMVSIVNSVWITSAHLLLFDQYIAHHAREAEMMTKMPLSPHVMMLVTGPIVGVVSGLILGLFAVVANRLVRRL
jgi:uncharacterized membrane protein